jgi:predicted nucleotidyltransferase component of viral defense system
MTLHNVIAQRLDGYRAKSATEQLSACKEILQEIALLGLSRTDFFQQAAFHGGTALRLFHKLDRFSEDLDFALHKQNTAFELKPYLTAVADELTAWGFYPEVVDRSKSTNVVKKAFLKESSLGAQVVVAFQPDQKLTIKLEVDSQPPEGATVNPQFADFPLDFTVVTHDLASLCAGKLHALLCRSYLKGRDWYDLVEYCRWQTTPNWLLLTNALNQAGPFQNSLQTECDSTWLVRALSERIQAVSIEVVKFDVQPFLIDTRKIEHWSQDMFLRKVEKWCSGM